MNVHLDRVGTVKNLGRLEWTVSVNLTKAQGATMQLRDTYGHNRVEARDAL